MRLCVGKFWWGLWLDSIVWNTESSKTWFFGKIENTRNVFFRISVIFSSIQKVPREISIENRNFLIDFSHSIKSILSEHSKIKELLKRKYETKKIEAVDQRIISIKINFMNIGQLCEMMYSLIEILKKKEKITADIFMQINPTKFKNNKKLK